MLKKLKRWLWKRGYLLKLEHESFLKEAMSHYSRSTVNDIQNLKQSYLNELAAIERRMKSLENYSNISDLEKANLTDVDRNLKNDYEREKMVKELRKSVDVINVKITGFDRSIERMNKEVTVLMQQSQEISHRRDVFNSMFEI